MSQKTKKPRAEFITVDENGKLRLNLHPGQTRTWDSRARFVFMLAGSQGGKTSFGPWWLHREIYDPVIGRGGGDYLAVTSTFDLFKLKMLPEMRRVFEDYLGVARFWPGDKILELKDPDSGEFWAKRSSDVMWGRIILRSASAEGGLESTTARAAWLDEVGQEKFSLDAWEAILRRLSLEQGRVLGTTTLYTTGWLKQQVYDEWVRGDPEYECIQFASYINPLFNRKEYETRKSKMPEWKFRMFYRGEFTRPPGVIYGDYDETRHKIPRFPIPSHWPRYVGLDPGGINLATMWLAHDQVHNRFFAYRSTLEGEMTTREHVEKAKERGAGENVRLWAGAAPSEDQVRKDWGDHGITVMKPTVADVESGIDRVAELFKTNRLYIFDDLTGLRDELGSYSRELDKNLEPTEKIKDKNLYHRCFVAGTLIATSRGDVPIEHVQIGDLVLTRQGFQPVVDACMTDPAADVHTLVASDGRSLTGTGNHPIFTQNRGLVSLDSLRYSDIITLCEHVGNRYNISGETGWHGRNQEPIEMLSSIGGASLCVTLIAAIAQIVSTIVQWIMMVKNTCIGTSMNARSVQSRLAPLSIIKTEIHSTTIRRITSWLNPILSTWRSTLPKYQTIDSPNFANLRKLGEHLRLSGTNPKLAANGTANMESGHGKTDLPLLTFVSSAINRSKRLPVMETPDFVATSIRPLLGSPVELTTKNAHAHAETPLPVTNTVNSACAAAHVLDVIAEIEPKPVYNLTIADAHEYFANGILVHNCDALRYIATWLPTADASDIDVSAQESMNPWEFIQPASAMTPGVPFAVRNAPTATPAADAVRW